MMSPPNMMDVLWFHRESWHRWQEHLNAGRPRSMKSACPGLALRVLPSTFMHLNFSSSINLSSHTPSSFSSLASSRPNTPPSAQPFIFSYYNSGNRVLSARQSVPWSRLYPPGCSASAANPLSKGQEGPSLARCLMGSDSSVFWDYARWKGGHSSPGGLCHCLLLTRQLFKDLTTPMDGVKGKNPEVTSVYRRCPWMYGSTSTRGPVLSRSLRSHVIPPVVMVEDIFTASDEQQSKSITCGSSREQ